MGLMNYAQTEIHDPADCATAFYTGQWKCSNVQVSTSSVTKVTSTYMKGVYFISDSFIRKVGSYLQSFLMYEMPYARCDRLKLFRSY